MSVTVAQRSFARGEVGPEIYPRVDQEAYAISVRTCYNWAIKKSGGAWTRPGTVYCGTINDVLKTVRMERFVFNASQTYVLEFGHLYLRIWKNGAKVTDVAKNITGATQANPCVITANAHGFANGDEVIIAGVVGMTELNGRTFKIANVTANTFSLQYAGEGFATGSAVNSTGFGAYVSGGVVSRVYTVATPYTEAHLPALVLQQTADVIKITHRSYNPRELVRTADASWTLSSNLFEPKIGRPTGIAVSGTGGGGLQQRYAVTAIAAENSEESLIGFGGSFSLSGITIANPGVFTTTAAHGFVVGDLVYIADVVGTTQVNNRTFIVNTTPTGTTFTLRTLDGVVLSTVGMTAYSSGGTVSLVGGGAANTQPPATGTPITVTWTAVAGAASYHIYRYLNGVHGFVGVASNTSFVDVGYAVDTGDSPPMTRDYFLLPDEFPGVSGYCQERWIPASTNKKPETAFASRSGNYNNFSRRTPIQDDDPFDVTCAGREVNEIRHLIDVGHLLVMTSAAEYLVKGDSAGILKPSARNVRRQSQHGASTVRPLFVGGRLLFVQERGQVVHDYGFDFGIDGYMGTDLTVWSTHLFRGYTLVDAAYQKNPNSTAWFVRNDGILLGLTYVPEQKLFAWHRHDVGGTIENVVCVPEGSGTSAEDVVYLVVKRSVNGITTRYVERLARRDLTDPLLARQMDCCLTYDGRNTDTSKTMTLTTGGGWTYPNNLTCTSSHGKFSAADIGNAVHLTGSDGTKLRCTILAYTSATVVTVRADKDVPAAMQGAAITNWALAVKSVSGLWHLEGKPLSVLGDDFVDANPNTSGGLTVAAGKITLPRPRAVITAGLPIVADLETLDIDSIQGETLMSRKVNLRKVTLFVSATRGFWVGQKAPASGQAATAGLREYKMRSTEDYDLPPAAKTEPVTVAIPATWKSGGRVLVRAVDPLPAEVFAIAPEGKIPF